MRWRAPEPPGVELPHLLINRLLDVCVPETKLLAEGVSIDAHS